MKCIEKVAYKQRKYNMVRDCLHCTCGYLSRRAQRLHDTENVILTKHYGTKATFKACHTIIAFYNCFCFFLSCFRLCFLPEWRWEGEPALLFISSSSEKLLSQSSAPSFSGSRITACHGTPSINTQVIKVSTEFRESFHNIQNFFFSKYIKKI